MVVKLQTFMIKTIRKGDSNRSCLAVISLDYALKKWKLLSTSIFKRVQIY